MQIFIFYFKNVNVVISNISVININKYNRVDKDFSVNYKVMKFGKYYFTKKD